MSRTIEKKETNSAAHHRDTRSVELKEAFITPEQSDQSSRLQFYREYRDAFREFQEGRPERLWALRDHPRNRPSPESLVTPPRPREVHEQASPEPPKLLAEANQAIASLLSSVRGLTTALASFLR